MFSLPGENERERETERKREGRYAQARMEVADCVGVEPGVRLASPSVSSHLGRPDRHVTDAKTRRGARTSPVRIRPHLIGATDGGTRRALSVSVMEGPGSRAPRLAVPLQHGFYHTNAPIICTHGQVFSRCGCEGLYTCQLHLRVPGFCVCVCV